MYQLQQLILIIPDLLRLSHETSSVNVPLISLRSYKGETLSVNSGQVNLLLGDLRLGISRCLP